MRDDRICLLTTADVLGRANRFMPIFRFKSGDAVAYYIFGRRVYDKGWPR